MSKLPVMMPPSPLSAAAAPDRGSARAGRTTTALRLFLLLLLTLSPPRCVRGLGVRREASAARRQWTAPVRQPRRTCSALLLSRQKQNQRRRQGECAPTSGGGDGRIRWGRALRARGGGGGNGKIDAPRQQQQRQAAKSARNLASASAFSALAGSFYLWSMLLPALQAEIDGCSRAALSAIFSVSTVCFTAGTSLGPMLFGTAALLPVSGVVLLTGIVSALGLLLAADGGVARGSLAALAVGYAAIFGTSTGVSYALNVKVSNAPGLFDGWQGLATGIIVSFRALGAPLFAPIVRRALAGGGGARDALRAMAGAVAVLSVPIAALMSRTSWEDLGAKAAVASSNNSKREDDAPPLSEHRTSLALLWTCMLCGSFPGLLAHGHAGAMAAARGGAAAGGVSAMATGSLWGRLGAGVVVDALSPKVCLVATPILAAIALGCGAALPGTVSLNVALCGMGLCYGMNAVVISVMTARIVGPDAFSRAYGLVFTSWGLAGILAPILAGLLYDATGGYTAAILIATAATLLAATAAAFLPNPDLHGK